MLKVVIVLLFIAVVFSLSSSLIFLFKDTEASSSKRTLYALGIRIGLASTLMACIAYGLYTGKLGSTAPWDKQAQPVQTP